MFIGHEKTVSDLKRLADEGNLSHGYIFFGPSGVGKRLAALSLAGYLENGKFEPVPLFLDALVIKPDEKRTVGIDAVREIKHFLWQKPNKSARRTVVIDEADFMTGEAQDALLKIAEEPPVSSLLILIAEEPENLRFTLVSRLQKIYFSIVPKKRIAAWLEEEVGAKNAVAAADSFGRPGLAWALAKDKRFAALMKSAEAIVKSAPAARREAIKRALDKEDFNLETLLDVMIIRAAARDWKTEKNRVFWHKLLALRGEAHYFNLNPRLQLENLFY